jgi:polar amino acid transport system substrate-binding protein
MKKRTIAVLAAVMVMLLLAGCGASQKTAGLTVKEGKFIVGFDQNFPPMGFVGDDGEFTGFDLELAAEVAKRLDLELVLQPIAWDSKDEELSTKNIDCIWNGFTMNGREDGYTWTEPYMANTSRCSWFVPILISLLWMTWQEKSVCVQVDSSAEAALEDNPELVGILW